MHRIVKTTRVRWVTEEEGAALHVRQYRRLAVRVGQLRLVGSPIRRPTHTAVVGASEETRSAARSTEQEVRSVRSCSEEEWERERERDWEHSDALVLMLMLKLTLMLAMSPNMNGTAHGPA